MTQQRSRGRGGGAGAVGGAGGGGAGAGDGAGGRVADEVDRLVAAWQRERPDLDVEPMAVLSRVSRLARHLEQARRAAFGRHGLEGFEFDVLASLRRVGPPYVMSPGQLGAATMVASGTTTHRLDRLEARGLVRRRPDPRDGRSVRVRLTARGRARVDAAFADLLERERALLARLPGRDRAALAGLLRTVLTSFDGTGGGAAGAEPSATVVGRPLGAEPGLRSRRQRSGRPPSVTADRVT